MRDDFDVEQMIALVSQNPCIWDKSVDSSYSRTEVNEAWRNICRQLHDQFDELQENDKHNYEKTVLKKWRNIKDQWLKTIKKMESHIVTGGVTPRVRPYMYHHHLSFLNKCGKLKDEPSHPELPVYRASNNTPGSSHRKNKAPAPDEEEEVRKTAKFDLDNPVVYTVKEEDPKVMFFKGILPHMIGFTDDENLEFQSGMLQLIQTIKKKRLNDTKCCL